MILVVVQVVWVTVGSQIRLSNQKQEDLNETGMSALDRQNLITNFNLLDADRCYHTDEKGEPNIFQFTIKDL